MAGQKAGKSLTLKPLYDRVIVRRDAAEETHKGLIIIPDAAKEKMQTGVVVAAGEGRVSDLTNDIRPMSVKKDDKVLFGKFTGDEITVNGEELIMMREDQIYGIIKE
jgi:chaperonin GroES